MPIQPDRNAWRDAIQAPAPTHRAALACHQSLMVADHMLGATVTKAMTAPEGGALTVWGAGEEARDLLYVDDLVRCVSIAVERQKAPFALYNVGAGRAVKVRHVVERAIAAAGRRLAIKHDLSQPTIPVSLARRPFSTH